MAANEMVAAPEGLLVVNKPAGPTSHDVVQLVKRKLGATKAGHLGTLDPMAEGVLVVCLEGATKVVPFISDQDKEYKGTIVLGAQTDTWDAEGKVTARYDPSKVTREDIEEVFAGMTGEIKLEAPAYSAIKQGGEPLYRKARRGEVVNPPIRVSHVYEMELLDYQPPRAGLRCVVSAGTYVRSLARETGKRLGVGAYLEKLYRIRSGNFSIEDAVSIEDLESADRRGFIEQKLVQLRDALGGLPELCLNDEVALRVQNGGFVSEGNLEPGDAGLNEEGETKLCKAVNRHGQLIAVMEKQKGTTNIWKPVRVWRRCGD